MKKKITLLVGVLLIISSVNAQMTFDDLPGIADSARFIPYESSNMGTIGMNQVWNFSDLSIIGEYAIKWNYLSTDVMSDYESSKFTEADLVLEKMFFSTSNPFENEQERFFLKKNASGLLVLGAYLEWADSEYQTYGLPLYETKTPLMYGYNYSYKDSVVSYSGSNQELKIVNKTVQSIECDGSGRFISPYGFYDNVLRVKVVNKVDSITYNLSTGSISSHLQKEDSIVKFYERGNAIPLAIIEENEEGYLASIRYEQNPTNTDENARRTSKNSIYPNPACLGQRIVLSDNFMEVQSGIISVFNMTGNLTYTREFTEEIISISSEEIGKGVFIYEITLKQQDDFTRTTGKFIIK